MPNEEITTRFKCDISDLKKGITEANKAIKLANAEFSAATAKMDDWSSSSNGLTAKLTQLNSVLDSQKKKLQNYKDQQKALNESSEENGRRASELKQKLQELASQGVSKTSAEYKKYKTALSECEKEQQRNKTAADNLKVTILNQQAAVDKTEKEIGEYKSELDNLESESKDAEKAAEELNDELDNTDKAANNAKGGFTVLKGALASLVADGFRKAIDAAKEFAKSMITTAAEVKAQNAQYEQTFGDMAGKADETIGRVANSTGILENRLKSSATGIYSFAKASGADAPKAMSLMETSLTAAADTAAYYDMSLDEATERLQAFMKGNFANDAALGVSCTETTRNAKATELFGKKYNELSEIQKQETLLKMVTDAQKASGAFGQASRESDGWENVMGNLNQAWTDFKAQVGTPFLEALIPIIQEVTKSFQEWVQSVDWEAFKTTVQDIFDKIIEGFKWVIDNKELVIGGFAAIAGIVGTIKLINFINDMNNLVKIVKGWELATKAQTAAQWLLNAAQSASPTTWVILGITALVAAFVLLWKNCEGFREFWINLWEKLKKACSAAKDWIGKAIDGIVKFFKELPSKVWTWLQNTINKVTTWSSNMVKKAKDAALNFINKVVEYVKQLPEKVWVWLTNVVSKVSTWAGNLASKGKEAALNFINRVVNYVSQLPSKVWTWLTNVASKVGNWGSNLASKGKEAAQKLFNAIVDKVKEIPDKILSVGRDLVSGLWNGVNDKVQWLKNKISGFVGDVTGWIKKFFKIGSPSKLMEEEVGKWLPEGIAVGIDKNAKSVLSSMKGLAVNTVGAVKSSLDGASHSLTSGTSSIGGGVVNNFTQVINSPKQLSRLDIYRQSKNLLGFAGGGA